MNLHRRMFLLAVGSLAAALVGIGYLWWSLR